MQNVSPGLVAGAWLSLRNRIFGLAPRVRREIILFVVLCVCGVCASNINVSIPHTPFHIDGRWIFGFIGYALLARWWEAFLLGCILSVGHLGETPIGIVFVGNMLFAVPTLLVVRPLYRRILAGVGNYLLLGGAWLLLVLLCYQVFGIPSAWGYLAYLRGTPVLPAIAAAFLAQPFLVESFLVGVLSGSGLLVLRSHEIVGTFRSRYRELFEGSRDGYVFLDASGRIVDANSAYCSMLGYTLRELRSMESFHELTPERWHRWEAEEVWEKRLLGKGYTGVYEKEYRRKDGTVFPVEIQGYAVRDTSGRFQHVWGVVRDITERKRAQVALAESEKRYRDMFEKNRAIKLLIGPETGAIVDANSAACEFYGYTWKEITQRRIWDINTLGEAATRERMRRVLNGVQPSFVFSHRLSTGEVRQVEAHSGPLELDGKVYLHSIILDVTQRVEAEAERERLLSAIEQADEVIVITDVEGTIEYVNPAFTKVTGYEHEEAIGRNPSILKSGEQDVSFYRDMWEQLNSGHVWRGRFVNRRKDGELYTEEATITPVRDADGNVVNFVAVKRDITDELKRERQFQQVERIEAVGQLAGGVAHDFNNLLTGIMNYVDLCLDRVSGDATLSGYLAQLKVDAERSANLTKQLLAFARRQEISPEVLDLNEVVSGTLDLLRRLIGEDIRLRWLPNPEPVPVRVDPSQLDQVLVNLIINARDAIGGVGTIVVSTKCRTIADTDRPFSPDARPGEWVVLAVADDGEGMSPDTMANIFEPFFTTKAASEGTGLGLSTVYGIVKQNLGFIDVSSELGEGTVFSIHLPRVSGAAAELQHPRETAERSDRVVQGGGETILVVEDERSIRTTCRAFLEKLGYKVLVASDPTEALRLVGGYEDVLHLVITDVVMPGMNGAQLAGKLREQRPGLACIFMSGYTDDIIANRGVLEHDTEFLGKPFTREDLEATVRRVLDAS